MLNHRNFPNNNNNSSLPSTPSPQMPQRNIAQVYIANPPPTPIILHPNRPFGIDSNTTNFIPNGNPRQTQTNTTANGSQPESALPPGTDVVGSILGDFGIWQLRTILILFLCKLPASWFMACIIFTAPEIKAPVEYSCSTSGLQENQEISSDQCYVDQMNATGAIVSRESCVNFVYNFDFQSLIMQFNLVCLRDIFVAWTQFWHLFGVLVGGVIATKLMLRLSPRTVYIIGMVVQIIFGVVTGYARDFTVHCVFRCLSAICCAFMFTAAQAIFTDITAGKYRTGVIILYDTFWSLGVILLPGISSFFSNWSQLYLGITFPTLLLMILLQWTPESPRWLLKNGIDRDVHTVERIIREAADINDRTFYIPVDFRQQLEALREKLRQQPPPASWLKLWQGKRAKTHMIASHIALAVYITNHMGMLLNLRSFGREYRVPNTIVMGIAEMFGCFIALHFMLKHNNWKFQYAGIFNVIGGLIACICWTFTAATLNPDLKVTLWMIVAVIPKASISCAQSLLLGCLAELQPLNKKAQFVFSAVTWARMWLLTAPFINVLKKIDTAASLSAFGVLTVMGGLFTCLLLSPRSKTKAITLAQDNHSNSKKEQSPLAAAVWTVEGDISNTRL